MDELLEDGIKADDLFLALRRMKKALKSDAESMDAPRAALVRNITSKLQDAMDAVYRFKLETEK